MKRAHRRRPSRSNYHARRQRGDLLLVGYDRECAWGVVYLQGRFYLIADEVLQGLKQRFRIVVTDDTRHAFIPGAGLTKRARNRLSLTAITAPKRYHPAHMTCFHRVIDGWFGG